MTQRNIPLYKVHMPPEAYMALKDVMFSGQIANGLNVVKFESLLQEYIGNPYITSTGDVSSSIAFALFMAGVRPGDEVLTSPMACLSTNEPIKNLFAQAIWCDIDPLTGNIDPADVERHLSSRTKVILVYHWAGNPVDLEAIMLIAKRHGLSVVEDAGEALGAEYGGRKIGNTGTDFTIFSFYPNRHITTGEGAAIAFGSAEAYESGRWLKRYGIHQPSFRDSLGEINIASDIAVSGYNTYMNQIAATIGVTQMSHIADIVARHQSNGVFYDEALRSVPGITVLKKLPGTQSAYWVYTFLADRRDDLLRFLRSKGVYASKVHFRNDQYSCFKAAVWELPGVSEFSAHCLSIPCGWWVSDKDRVRIVDVIRGETI